MVVSFVKILIELVYGVDFFTRQFKRALLFYWRSDISYIKKRFFRSHGYKLNIRNPKSLNEKIQWLKMYDRQTLHTVCADKLAVREYFRSKFGHDHIIPLLFQSQKASDITSENLPDTPFILKTNHDAGSFIIVRDKSEIDWNKTRLFFKFALLRNYYWVDREWQYKQIGPKVFAEKLLVCENGKIPNDFKVHCFNGRTEIIYVAMDREGLNVREIFNRDWERLSFYWGRKKVVSDSFDFTHTEKPPNLELMLELSERVAIDFPHYVRVDFYDVDGKLYFGEITQHHGGGFEPIVPIEWDYKLGDLISL